MPFQVEHQVEIPTGEFIRARLKTLDVATVPYNDKKTGEAKTFTKLNWVFEITEAGDFFGKEVRGETSAYLSDSPYNQFRNWAEALLQRPLDLGQVLDESDLVGLAGVITCKKEKDKSDSSKFWTRIDDVIPLDDSFGTDEPPF